VVIDLNGLKRTNDEQGHAAGDDLLVRAGRAITAAVRAHDPVARLGGDEFAVLLRDCTQPAAGERADHIRASLLAAGVDAAVGAAAAMPGLGVAEAQRAADAAMYVEKRRPRDG
jgi:diguanylate cyclase